MSATTKIKSLLLSVVSLFSFLKPQTAPPAPPVVTVLCYHTFDSGLKNPYNVSSVKFDDQMRYLQVQKIPVIPLSALTDHLYLKTPLPERSVVITIDDGYRSGKDIAWPLLKRYGFPFTLYVYPQAISRVRSALTWQELRHLAKNGVDIQSHSMTHPLLTHPKAPMNPQTYKTWMDQELLGSKQKLEAELGQPVTSLAYPFGGYDEFIVERAKAAGYKTALTCNDGEVSAQTDPLLLNRRLVFRQTTLKAFTRYFLTDPLSASDLQPRNGERLSVMPTEIRGRLGHAEQLDLASAKILVDKLSKHWRPVTIDPGTGSFQVSLPADSRRGYYFVSLMVNERDRPERQREATWLFIIKRNASKK